MLFNCLLLFGRYMWYECVQSYRGHFVVTNVTNVPLQHAHLFIFIIATQGDMISYTKCNMIREAMIKDCHLVYECDTNISKGQRKFQLALCLLVAQRCQVLGHLHAQRWIYFKYKVGNWRVNLFGVPRFVNQIIFLVSDRSNMMYLDMWLVSEVFERTFSHITSFI